jgi:uncharacterized protein YlxW (UPF0749 family)
MINSILLASLTGGYMTLLTPLLAIFALLTLIGKPKAIGEKMNLEDELAAERKKLAKLQEEINKYKKKEEAQALLKR